MDPNIAILAGGVSSRMKKALADAADLDASLRRDAAEKPKAMIGVGGSGRPFMDHLLENVAAAGYRNVCIVVGERDGSIREYYENPENARRLPGLEIRYALQPIPAGRTKPLGTADAVHRALLASPAWKGRRLTVCNSDNIYSVKALRLLLEDGHPNAMIDYDRSALRFPAERIAAFAVIRKDTDGFLLDILEKPSADEIERAADARGRIGVSMNMFRFSYDPLLACVERVPMNPVRQEKELPEAVRMMLAEHPRSMFTIPLSEHVPDLTSPGDILRVKGELEPGSGNISLDPHSHT
jgi:glucose-1-phosphate adenylyltransferase